MAALGIHIGAVIVGDMLRGPGVELLRQLRMAGLEERPFQIIFICHFKSP